METRSPSRTLRRLQKSRLRAAVTLILLGAWGASACTAAEFDAGKLFVDVFVPEAGETVLIMVDSPTTEIPDHLAWKDRRAMAEEWRSILQGMASDLGITVLPLMSYEATGSHNGPIPQLAVLDGELQGFEEIVSKVNIAIAMTEFSATAPMMELTAKYPDLRVASMPMVSRRMQETALAADYSAVSTSCRILRDRLDQANGARVKFSTGHEMYFDLRHRKAEVDDGRLDGSLGSARVINLPSGEAFIAPYEGELEGDMSKTQGMIPVAQGPESGPDYVIVVVEANRIVDVLDGTAPEFAIEGRGFLEQDPAMRNVAELGLGCNPSAVVTGNILEDEKVVGIHWALGRSDHIGGTVGPDDFQSPEFVTHMDFVYPIGSALEVETLAFEYPDGTVEAVISGGANRILDDGQASGRTVLLIWLLISAACWSWVAWDSQKYAWSATSREYLWAFAALFLGPIGLVLYLRSRPPARANEGLE